MIEFQTTYRLEPFDPSYHPVNLPRFDNVKLAAVATCPTYGIMRYQHHKVYASPRRPMPLIAGLAAHDAFAAIRLGDLYFNGEVFYGGAFNVRQIATEHAIHLFGKDRATDWVTAINRGEDLERSIMLGALDIFESSGYYDDPDDKRRTIANIEETIVAYCSRYPLGKIMVFVGLDVRQKRFVGIEVPLDMFLHIEHADGVFEYRFTGRVDAVMWPNTKRTHISIEDDKTASRLNEAWHESWKIAHQPTGYCLGIGALLDAEVNRGVIRGASIPLPKTYDYGGIATVPFIRSPLQFIEWADHVVHIMSIVDKYNDRPLNAPRYTVSCNKYFRPCNYIPFCDSSVHERGIMFNEMDTEVWDPLFGTHYEDEEHDS
jgi:hypothetical protein